MGGKLYKDTLMRTFQTRPLWLLRLIRCVHSLETKKNQCRFNDTARSHNSILTLLDLLDPEDGEATPLWNVG